MLKSVEYQSVVIFFHDKHVTVLFMTNKNNYSLKKWNREKPTNAMVKRQLLYYCTIWIPKKLLGKYKRKKQCFKFTCRQRESKTTDNRRRKGVHLLKHWGIFSNRKRTCMTDFKKKRNNYLMRSLKTIHETRKFQMRTEIS